MKTAQEIIDAYDGGSIDLRGCDLTGITLPTSIGGWLYLSGCDLTGITLPTSVGGSLDLSGCDLNGITLPTSIGGSIHLHKSPWAWAVTMTSERMTIGCKTFSHAEWSGFSDSEISEMEERALAFWKKHKAELMSLCAHMAQ